MKASMKMLTAALALGSVVAFADEPAKAAPAAAAPAATAAKPAPAARPKMTEAQRAEMRARREKFMAERRAAMEAKMLEVVKKYVPEEEKAKALIKELEETVLKGNRRMPKGRPLPAARPAAPKAAAPATPAAPAK